MTCRTAVAHARWKNGPKAAPADFGAFLRRSAANSYTVCAGILHRLRC